MPTYKIDGEKITAKNESEARGKHAQGSFLGGLVSLIPIALIAGFILIAVLMAAAGLRGFVVLAKTFPLFGISGLLALVFMIFVMRKIRIKFFFRLILGLIAAAFIAVPGCWLSYKYYSKTNMHFPSVYSADYIKALPDGTAPLLYEKRFQKGKVLAELSVGEKVTINGVTVGYGEYNITTANNVKGWIPVAALPEDAADMLSITISVDGFDSEDIAVDRETELLMERYMDKAGKNSYVLSKSTLNNSVKMNVQTPLMTVDSKAYKNGAELANSGAKVTLENIIYSKDCTIVYLTVTDKNARDLSGTFNTSAWKKSLVVKDLNTGETWPVLQADYKKTFKYDKVDEGYKSSVVYFFPPFKSRHFSLGFGDSPLPPQKKAGYSGLLGLAASAAGGSNAVYLSYNFPEVRVK